MNVRFANLADYDELSSFYKTSLQRKWLKDILSKRDETTKVILAEYNSEIAGRLLLYIIPWTAGKKKGKRAIISEVFVKEEYRRKGIAKAMVRFCISKTKKEVEDVQIDRVEKENKGAIRLYRNIFPKPKLVFSS